MKHIHLQKLYFLDENYKFPKCLTCGNDLSPFRITLSELQKLDKQTIYQLIMYEFLIADNKSPNNFILFLCKYCLKDDIQFKL